MRNTAVATLGLVALASQAAAFQWPTDKLYNKWHETKLERWLKDHNIPFPEASDRQSLYNTVEANWNKITPPYDQWSEKQLRDWLTETGSDAAEIASAKKDELVNLVQSTYEDASSPSLADWILDSWTDSQLKSFLDYHKIPNPTPRNRDSLLQSARNAYSDVASIGPSVYDTLFGQWQDSDLKAWADARGIPVPQGSTKESILASFRKNTKSFTDQAKEAVNSVLGNDNSIVFDTWSESQLKKALDENGVPVPQGSKLNELRALARKNGKTLKNKAGQLYADAADAASKKADEVSKEAQKQGKAAQAEAKKYANSAADAAAKKGGEVKKEAEKQAAAAADAAKKQGKQVYDDASKKAAEYGDKAKNQANAAYADARAKAGAAAAEASAQALGSDNILFNAWSDSRLKAFLDARGVPVPQNGKKDELIALARQNGRKARLSADDFAGWSNTQLQKFAKDAKIKLDSAASASRDELERQVEKGYAEAKKQGNAASKQAEKSYADVKSYAFESWSNSDLKSYLDSYGVPVPQNGKTDELIALARKNGHYFANGQTGPVAGSPLAQMATDGLNTLLDFVKKASGIGYQKAQEAAEQVRSDL